MCLQYCSIRVAYCIVSPYEKRLYKKRLVEFPWDKKRRLVDFYQVKKRLPYLYP